MATNYVYCPSCHTQNTNLSATCFKCGAMLPISPMPMQPAPNYGVQNQPQGADKKLVAGICGILLGGFGVHKFILGYQNEGVILLSATLIGFVIALITCGIGTPLVMIPGIIGLIEGIMYLTKSDEEFVSTYIHNKKAWF